MNNRYICKAKRKDNNEWVEGVAIFADNKAFILNNAEVEFITGFNENRLNFVLVEVIPETVRQCTGLKDKNGKLIFDGDIVVSTSDRRLSDRPRLITIDFERGCNYCAARRKPVVIGNIHDNPELLEKLIRIN